MKITDLIQLPPEIPSVSAALTFTLSVLQSLAEATPPNTDDRIIMIEDLKNASRIVRLYRDQHTAGQIEL